MGCKKALRDDDVPHVRENSHQDSKAAMRKVSIPLQKVGETGEIQLRGRAIIEILSLGPGKNGGGLMRGLSPAIRAEGTSVEVDGEDLFILAELSSTLRTMIPATEIQFRGLVVRGRESKPLLECSRATVDVHEKWKFQRARLNGGSVQAEWEVNLSNQNPTK